MLVAGLHNRNAGLLADFLIGNDTGICLEHRILRTERQDLEFALRHKRHAQIVERHHLLDLIGVHLGEIHRDVAAHGVSHHGQTIIVRVRLDLFHFIDRKADVGNAALVLRQAPDIEFADFRHHRRIGRQIMLDADRQIAAGGKNVRQERVLGEFHGIAVVEDRHRQRNHAGVRLHFLVAPYGDIDGDRTVAAHWIVERKRLVADRPFARGEIRDGHQRGKRNQYGNSTFHVVVLGAATPKGLCPNARDSAVPCP